MSSPELKNISLFPKCEQWHIYRHPVPLRGAYHDRHERGTGMRWTPKLRQTIAADAYGKGVWS